MPAVRARHRGRRPGLVRSAARGLGRAGLAPSGSVEVSGSGLRRARTAQRRDSTSAWPRCRLALTKAAFGERNDAYYGLRKAMRDEYEITLDLLAREATRTSLRWLSAPVPVSGCWRCGAQAGADGGRPANLGVERTGAGGDLPAPGPKSSSLATSTCQVEHFPPEELFQAAGPDCFGLHLPGQEHEHRLGLPRHRRPHLVELRGPGLRLHVVGHVQRGPGPSFFDALPQPAQRGPGPFVTNGKRKWRGPCARARSVTPWRRRPPTTACGTGTSRQGSVYYSLPVEGDAGLCRHRYR